MILSPGPPISVPGRVVGTPVQIAAVASLAGFTGQNLTIAVAVALAESGGNAYAISPAKDYGLWQINYSAHKDLFNAHQTTTSWADPQVNGADAISVFRAAGNKWSPWVTYWTGAYFVHMGTAQTAVAQLGNQNAATVAAPFLQQARSGAGGISATGSTPTQTPNAQPAAASSGPVSDQGALLRLIEIFIGGAMLVIGLKQLTTKTPVISPLLKKIPVG